MKQRVIYLLLACAGLGLSALVVQSLYAQTNGGGRTPTTVPTDWTNVTPSPPAPQPRTPITLP